MSEMSNLMASSLPSPSPIVSPPTPPIFLGISYSKMSLLQHFCSKVQNLRQSSAMKIVPVPVSGSKLFCDLSTGVICPLVPEPMRRAVFESINIMSRDVNLWTQSCISCQRSKVQTHIKTRVQTRIKTPVQTHIKTPVQTHIKTPVHTHIRSLVRPLPQFCGFSYLFTIIVSQDGWRQSFCSSLQQKILCVSSYVQRSLCSECHW